MFRRCIVTVAALLAVFPAAAVARGTAQNRAETGWGSPAVAAVGDLR
ncbi:hypothetical protein [Dactylosporangium sp. NPDC000521]